MLISIKSAQPPLERQQELSMGIVSSEMVLFGFSQQEDETSFLLALISDVLLRSSLHDGFESGC
jgi:hypothetical protein